MKFGSICSGIEAASQAWLPLGWRCAFMSEIEPSARAVLEHHYGGTPLHGDFTTIEAGQYAGIDVLVGGTPCQSFSVAGLRGGMADARGNLALEYLRLADRLRPRWVVWENVPGVLSSADGRDFGSFVGGLAELGYGWAYRTLDAQYFGLAQRRKRVFVVGYLGDWRRAAAVLFNPASLRGDPPPSRETRERIAPTIAARVRGGGGLGTDFDCDGGLITGTHEITYALKKRDVSSGGAQRDGMDNIVAMALNAHGGSGRMDGESETFVPTFLHLNKGRPDGRKSAHTEMVTLETETVPTLATDGHAQSAIAHSLRADGFDASEDGTGRGTPLVAFDTYNQTFGDVSQTLRDPNGTFGDALPAVVIPSDALYPKGVKRGVLYASPSQTNARALLLRVRREIGAETFAEWGLGILNSFQPAQILRPKVHGQELRQATFSRSWMVCCALGSPFSRAEGAMRSLREACRERCPSQGWGSLEQLADELGTYLSGLSQPGAQAERFVHDLWQADEGPWLLREALSEIQKVWRPPAVEGQPAHTGSAVRRLTATECEFLQGFPRNYTLIPYRGKPMADGPRYRLLGNSMAVPVVSWIGKRIQLVHNEECEKVSLTSVGT